MSDVEVRVVGALMEKGATTPDHYPLSTQALVAACNQLQNRSPVTAYAESDVLAAVQRLRTEEVVRSVKRTGDRVMKHQHDMDRALRLSEDEVAVLAVLLLRGPQTPGELRQRTERYVTLDSLEEVEGSLRNLADRDEPLVRSLGRQPGQKEDRWTHLLGGAESAASSATVVEDAVQGGPSLRSIVEELAIEVAALRAQLAALRADLGYDSEG